MVRRWSNLVSKRLSELTIAGESRRSFSLNQAVRAERDALLRPAPSSIPSSRDARVMHAPARRPVPQNGKTLQIAGFSFSRPLSRILREIHAIWLSHAGLASRDVLPRALKCCPRDAPVMHDCRLRCRKRRHHSSSRRGHPRQRAHAIFAAQLRALSGVRARWAEDRHEANDVTATQTDPSPTASAS